MEKFGMKFHYNADDKLADFILNEPSYLMRNQFNEDQIWLDAGANIGRFSVEASPFVKKIYAFEPVTEAYNYLLRNANENECRNVECFKQGLWVRQEGTGYIYLHKESSANNSMVLQEGRAFFQSPIEVSMVNYFDIIKKYKINCIKIDTEGGEAEFVNDLYMLNINLNILILEFHQRCYDDWDCQIYAKMCKKLSTIFRRVEYSGFDHYCATVKCFNR